ncbi:MAG: hypothetical protein HY513_02675 [Candidatus Aenigmarchaeota archaeon]|nr:hypothetical protein [Candidatus Aenigmarchaeota archaeon]
METIQKLPQGKFVIGAREIKKAIVEGTVKKVVVASNCPDFLVERLGKIDMQRFEGDQKDMGTKLGKPFAIAMVGY